MRVPSGQFTGSVPQNSDTRLPPKFATQTLSWPSTAMPQDMVSPPPVNGPAMPSALLLIKVMAALKVGLADTLPGARGPRSPELVTHMLPWLSAAIPSGLLRPRRR